MEPEFVAFSDNPRLTQAEYLRREFRIGLRCGVLPGSQEISWDSAKPLIIVSSSPANWVGFLRNQPPRSTIFFLLGNETYDKETFESLNNISALRHVFLYNPPKPVALRNLFKMFIGNVIDRERLSAVLEYEVLKDARASVKLWINSKKICLNYPWSEFPEGYSNSFVQGLKAVYGELGFVLSDDESLYAPKEQFAIVRHVKKETLFSFVGQTGRGRRQVSTDVVSKYFDCDIIYKDGFGGTTFDGDSRYVRSILNSKFPLIPPGWLNNSNHRYSEVLIANGLPAILAQNSTDPMESRNWTSMLRFPHSHSFKYLARRLSLLSQADFGRLLLRAQVDDHSRTQQARAKLVSILQYWNAESQPY